MNETAVFAVASRTDAKTVVWKDRVMDTQFNRIKRDIAIMGGKACIKGTRVTVSMIVTQISEGKTLEDMLVEYPYLSREDISEALRYAAWSVESREVEILPA